MLAPIRLTNAGSCPSRLAPIRPANAAAQLVLRTQAGRKEDATASLNLSVSPTRLRRYCCAVSRDERHCAATASRSGETQGEASPPPVPTSPYKYRFF